MAASEPCLFLLCETPCLGGETGLRDCCLPARMCGCSAWESAALERRCYSTTEHSRLQENFFLYGSSEILS